MTSPTRIAPPVERHHHDRDPFLRGRLPLAEDRRRDDAPGPDVNAPGRDAPRLAQAVAVEEADLAVLEDRHVADAASGGQLGVPVEVMKRPRAHWDERARADELDHPALLGAACACPLTWMPRSVIQLFR